MFAGLERIILYTKKGEINITAGTMHVLFDNKKLPSQFITIFFRLS